MTGNVARIATLWHALGWNLVAASVACAVGLGCTFRLLASYKESGHVNALLLLVVQFCLMVALAMVFLAWRDVSDWRRGA